MSDQDQGVAVVQPERLEVLRERLDAVWARVDKACQAAGRAQRPDLVIVTKFHPAADVLALAELGVRLVGENRDQEARAKAAEVSAAAEEAGETAPQVEWHFIGQLQTNKAKYVVRYAAAVQSVDRVDLVTALDHAMGREQNRLRDQGQPERAPLDCLIQVDLDDRPLEERPPGIGARGGAQSSEVMQLASAIAGSEHLRLRGVMAVAPLGQEPDPAFARLAEISAELQSAHPEAQWISAGMSADLEQAIAAGATHLRIGTDVLGPRPTVG